MNYQKVYMNHIHSSSLLCQLAQMWRSQILCDALICTGNVVTKAHRVVLLAACPMLQSMENASIGTELEVRLAADIKQEAVNSFLQYLYEGFMLLTEDNVKHVEKVARLLQVDSVIKCCSDFFKCLEKSTGKLHNANYKFDKYDLLEFRHVRTSGLQKTYQDRLMKRMNESPRPSSPTGGKRPRMHRPPTPQSDFPSQRADDAISMTQSYLSAMGSGGTGSVRSGTSSQSSRSGSPSVVEIIEDSLELVQREKTGSGQSETTRIPQQKTSISVASHVSNAKDTRVVSIADDGGGGRTNDSSSDRVHSVSSVRETQQSSLKIPFRDSQPSQNLQHPSSSSYIPRMPPNQTNFSSQPPPPPLLQVSQSFSQGHSQEQSTSQSRPQLIPTETFSDKFPFMTSTPQRSFPPTGAKPSFAAGSATQARIPSQSLPFPSQSSSQSPSQQQKDTSGMADIEKQEGESTRPQEGHDPGPQEATGDIADLAIVKIEKVGEDEVGGLMMHVDQGQGDGQRMGQFAADDEQEYDESDLTGDWSQEDLSNEGSMLQGDQAAGGAMYMGPTSVLGRYKCSYCGKRYGSKQGLKTHEREHSGIYPFTCKICSKGFSVRSRLLEHEMRHEDKPVGICFICGFEAKSFAGLRTHKNIHLENSYDCTECDKKFYSKQGLARHVILHKGGHVCDTCSKIFPSEEKLQKHLDSDSHKEKEQINEIFLKL